MSRSVRVTFTAMIAAIMVALLGMSGPYTLYRKLSTVGVAVLATLSADPASSPSITSGAGAPSATEPDGSVYLRNNGAADTTLYARASSAWVALEGAGGAGTVTDLTVTGNTTLGNLATADTVTFTSRISSDLVPTADDTSDLGSTTQEWRHLWIDGTANIDSLVADSADINGGTVDGAVIGSGSAAAGTFTTVGGTTITASVGFAGPLNGSVGAGTPASVAATTLTASSTGSVTGVFTLGSRFVHAQQTIDMADATHSLVLVAAGAGETQLVSDLVLVDANSSGTEDLLLPPTASSTGFVLFVMNVGGESFAVKTSDGGTTVVAAVAAGKGVVVACNGAGWGNILGS